MCKEKNCIVLVSSTIALPYFELFSLGIERGERKGLAIQKQFCSNNILKNLAISSTTYGDRGWHGPAGI
jgi:hypothetical protein